MIDFGSYRLHIYLTSSLIISLLLPALAVRAKHSPILRRALPSSDLTALYAQQQLTHACMDCISLLRLTDSERMNNGHHNSRLSPI